LEALSEPHGWLSSDMALQRINTSKKWFLTSDFIFKHTNIEIII
jgi:hypothetical protein